MIEFGKTLRTARETKGYTVAQLADITKLMPSLIEDLENEDFGRIAAPIYGRGFVKLYCEAVDLEPKPLVNEFMEILNGNRDTTIRERKIDGDSPEVPSVSAPVEPVAPPEPVASPEPTEPIAPPETDPLPAADDFRLEAEVQAAPVVPPEPDATQQNLFSEPAPARPESESSAPVQTISRYATPLDDHPGYAAGPSLSSFWRLGALLLAALALFVLILLGVRALYRATAPGGPERAPEPAVPAAATTPAAAPAERPEPAAPRQQQKIPDVYVD